MVLLEQLDVLLQNVEVRERCQVIIEIDAIVPHEDVVGNTAPALQGLDKVTSRSVVGEGYLPFTVDVAQHDVYVWQRLDMLRRVHREQVGQGTELFVRETFGQLVHKPDEVAGQGPLFLINLFAGGTMAIGEVSVVLADRNHGLAGIGPKDGVDLGSSCLKDLWIGQTPLTGISGTSFAINKRIVFGMALSETVGGEDPIEGVYPHTSGKFLFRLFQTEP